MEDQYYLRRTNLVLLLDDDYYDQANGHDVHYSEYVIVPSLHSRYPKKNPLSHHLMILVAGPESDATAFIRAFKDVFMIGSSVGLVAAFVFVFGGWHLAGISSRLDTKISK